MQRDSRVAAIEKDLQIQLNPPLEINLGKPGGGGGGGSSPAQTIPWEIARVGGARDGSGKTAWIIDTGTQLDHPDLNVDVQRSKSFLSGNQNTNPGDQNGHGTHVAGTIAALNNSIGVVDVAAGATVVTVRVLDRRGSGATSGVIAGVDYVAANGKNGDVANMSLGGGVSTTLDNAVINAAATGVKFSLAAGSESDDAANHSPARADGANIFTISAFDSSDRLASFSNFGANVEFGCPRVSVNST